MMGLSICATLGGTISCMAIPLRRSLPAVLAYHRQIHYKYAQLRPHRPRATVPPRLSAIVPPRALSRARALLPLLTHGSSSRSPNAGSVLRSAIPGRHRTAPPAEDPFLPSFLPSDPSLRFEIPLSTGNPLSFSSPLAARFPRSVRNANRIPGSPLIGDPRSCSLRSNSSLSPRLADLSPGPRGSGRDDPRRTVHKYK